MSTNAWTFIVIIVTFVFYTVIARRAVIHEAKGFYVPGRDIPPLVNGMATAADWLSAASFISMAGLISFTGFSGCAYLIGWSGGYIVLAVLFAPFLRKYGKFTAPDFVGDRYYSDLARVIALVCSVIIALTYVSGQIRGVGIIFSRFLEINISSGIFIATVVVSVYALLGGMKGITWALATQCVIILAGYVIPAAMISEQMTGSFIPQIGFGSTFTDGPEAGRFVLDTLDRINTDLGFEHYTSVGDRTSILNVLCITVSLMVGTAGLPHIMPRFYTLTNMRSARLSIAYALAFIAVLYTVAPAIAAFARYNMISTLNGVAYDQAPEWFKTWEKTGLAAWVDKNKDGKINYRPGEPFIDRPQFATSVIESGPRRVVNKLTENENELYIDPDIIVQANPEMAKLPVWVIALLAAGGLAAALSTAVGLLLVVASSISHDLYYRLINQRATETQQLRIGRTAILSAVVISSFFAVNPPASVAQVVAYAFSLAASSFFPTILLGIFWSRSTKEGAIFGILAGTAFSCIYIFQVAFLKHNPWLLGISPEGIGVAGMLINLGVNFIISLLTPPPPQEIQDLVEEMRLPVHLEAFSRGRSMYRL